MKVKLLFTGVFSFLTSIVSAQASFEWANNTGDSGNNGGSIIISDTSDNSYSIGRFTGTVDLDPGAGVANFTAATSSVYVRKLDPNGAYVWAYVLDTGGSITDIEIDSNGDIIVIGLFYNTMDFDAGAGVSNLTPNGSTYNTYILKISSAGNFMSVKKLDSNSLGVLVERITLDNLDNLYLFGSFYGTADFDPGAGVQNEVATVGSELFVLKIDPNADLVWVKPFGVNNGWNPNSINAFDMDVDISGNCVLSGLFRGTPDFDPNVGVNTMTASASYNVFVLKLDSNGNFLFSKAYGNTLTDVTFSPRVRFDNIGNVILGGVFRTTVDFDPGPAVANLTATGHDCYILKLSTIGDFIWAKQFGGSSDDWVEALAIDDDNNIYSGGRFAGSSDIDPGVGNYTINGFPGDYDMFFQKLTDNGNFVFGGAFAGVAAGTDNVFELNVNSLGSIYLSGQIATSSVDMDPTAGTSLVTSNGSFDNFNVKLSYPVCAPTSVDPDIASLSPLADECSVSAPTVPTASNCFGTFSGVPDVAFPITSQGTTTVTWMYNDGNGNTSTQTQNIIINDVTAPIADNGSLSNITAECEVTTLTPPTATDNCVGSITGTHNASLPITAQGTTTVTWTYDDGNGNTTTQTQDVIINDVTAPIADNGSLTNVTAECEVTSLTAPTATDNCAGSITGTHNASLPITAQGTTTVTWTYDDGNGNTSTQTQDVVITDVTDPVADLANLSDISNECEVTPIAPTATDNCSGAITGAPDVSFPITALGTTTVTWTYDDGNGNTSTQTQDIIIIAIDVNTTTTSNATDYTISADASGYNYQWIENCGTTNNVISGETNQSFTPTINGTYAVIIDNGTCSDTSDCIVIDDLGIEINDFGSAFKVYPNPTFGDLAIELGNVYNETSIKVFNSVGQVVVNESFGSTDNLSIQIAGTPGMYILEIKTQEGKSARIRVIKK